MNAEQQVQFRMEFKSIVYHKGLITENTTNVKRMHAWNKNGSHEKAIVKLLDFRTTLKIKLNEMLKGKDYEEWRLFSSKLARVNQTYARAAIKLRKAEIEIENLIFII